MSGEGFGPPQTLTGAPALATAAHAALQYRQAAPPYGPIASIFLRAVPGKIN
jgi:hypothetical protein